MFPNCLEQEILEATSKDADNDSQGR